jgi:hypothetical protein
MAPERDFGEAVAWVRQQVEFDRNLAAHQIPGPWRWWPMRGQRSFVGHEDDDAHGVPRVADCSGEHPTAWHIALHDPLDVTADCDAKLAILDLHEEQSAKAGENAMEEDRTWTLGRAVRLLASGYQFRDGYAEHWG